VRIRVILALLTALVAWLTWQFLPPPASPPLPENYHPQRAAWLDITWSMDAHTDAEIKTLAQDLQAHKISYVFAYTSYLKPGDFFNPTFDHAKHFTEQMHIFAPEITLLAWVGVPINVTQPGGQIIENRLANAHIRSIIGDVSREVVEELGFDGIHLNAEPIADGDATFITTLREIRSQLPQGAILSLAGQALHPTDQSNIRRPPTDGQLIISNKWLKTATKSRLWPMTPVYSCQAITVYGWRIRSEAVQKSLPNPERRYTSAFQHPKNGHFPTTSPLSI
jgi:hypothetical protein